MTRRMPGWGPQPQLNLAIATDPEKEILRARQNNLAVASAELGSGACAEDPGEWTLTDHSRAYSDLNLPSHALD